MPFDNASSALARYYECNKMEDKTLMLSKEKISDCLWQYYVEHYGEHDSDIWYEQPAANVWVFGRNGKIIRLKCHILTGAVTEHVE